MNAAGTPFPSHLCLIWMLAQLFQAGFCPRAGDTPFLTEFNCILGVGLRFVFSAPASQGSELEAQPQASSPPCPPRMESSSPLGLPPARSVEAEEVGHSDGWVEWKHPLEGSGDSRIRGKGVPEQSHTYPPTTSQSPQAQEHVEKWQNCLFIYQSSFRIPAKERNRGLPFTPCPHP